MNNWMKAFQWFMLWLLILGSCALALVACGG